jgi:hypothetical protein
LTLTRILSDLVGEGSDDDLYNEEELELIMPSRIRKRQSKEHLKGLLAY